MPERPLPTEQEVRALIHDRRNWGRWGKDDQVGAIKVHLEAVRKVVVDIRAGEPARVKEDLGPAAR